MAEFEKFMVRPLVLQISKKSFTLPCGNIGYLHIYAELKCIVRDLSLEFFMLLFIAFLIMFLVFMTIITVLQKFIVDCVPNIQLVDV